MIKKTNAILCAICTMFAIIFITGIHTRTLAYSTFAETSTSNTSIANMISENHGHFFILGNTDEAEIPAASEVVKTAKDILLTTSVYARNNSEMKVNDATRLEFVNQFGYCDEQTITVHEDVVSNEAKLMFERPAKDGRIGYSMYSFDRVYDYADAVKADDMVVEFNYLGFRYIIFVKNEQFCIAKKWDPEAGTHVYDCNESNNFDDLVRKLKEAFTKGKDITFIEESYAYYVRIHAFVNNGGQKEEFIFYTYNGAEVNDTTEIIASVDTADDNYTIYATDGKVALDSARRTAAIDYRK